MVISQLAAEIHAKEALKRLTPKLPEILDACRTLLDENGKHEVTNAVFGVRYEDNKIYEGEGGIQITYSATVELTRPGQQHVKVTRNGTSLLELKPADQNTPAHLCIQLGKESYSIKAYDPSLETVVNDELARADLQPVNVQKYDSLGIASSSGTLPNRTLKTHLRKIATQVEEAKLLEKSITIAQTGAMNSGTGKTYTFKNADLAIIHTIAPNGKETLEVKAPDSTHSFFRAATEITNPLLIVAYNGKKYQIEAYNSTWTTQTKFNWAVQTPHQWQKMLDTLLEKATLSAAHSLEDDLKADFASHPDHWVTVGPYASLGFVKGLSKVGNNVRRLEVEAVVRELGESVNTTKLLDIIITVAKEGIRTNGDGNTYALTHDDLMVKYHLAGNGTETFVVESAGQQPELLFKATSQVTDPLRTFTCEGKKYQFEIFNNKNGWEKTVGELYLKATTPASDEEAALANKFPDVKAKYQ